MSRLKKQNSFEENIKEQLSNLEIKPSDLLWERIDENLNDAAFSNALKNQVNNASFTPNKEVWQHIDGALPTANTNNRMLGYWTLLSSILIVGIIAGYFMYVPEPILVDNNMATVTNEFTIGEDIVIDNSSANNKAESLYNARNSHKANAKTLKKVAKKQQASNAKFNNKNTQVKGAKSSNSTINNGLLLEPTLNNKITKKTKKDKAVNLVQDKQVDKSLTENITPTVPLADNKTATDDKKKVAPKEVEEVKQTKLPKDSAATVLPAGEAHAYVKPEEELSKFSLTAFVGYQVTGMQLLMPASNGYNLQKSYNLRKDMESAGANWSGGFLLNYFVNKKMFVSSGIGINNSTQVLHYNLSSYFGADTAKIQPSSAYYHPNDSIVVGTSKSLENNYSFTEIPLSLTYILGNDKKLNMELTGGFSYAMITSLHNYQPDGSCIGLLQNIEKDQFPRYKNFWMAFGGVAATYKINSALAVGAQFYAKSAITGMVSNADWVQQKPYMIGSNLFIRKRF